MKDNYIPFWDEWEKEMMKFTKKELIDLFIRRRNPDPVALPEGQTDKEEPFQKFLIDEEESKLSLKKAGERNIKEGYLNANIQFITPTPSSYDGTLSEVHGLLNADEEHTGEEVQNSRGFYKRLTLEEFKKHASSMTDAQIKEFIEKHYVQQTK